MIKCIISGVATLLALSMLTPNQAHATDPTYNIGDTGPGGGVVFITPSTAGGDGNYFEAQISSVSLRPCQVRVVVAATATTIGSGSPNTTTIRDECAKDNGNTTSNSAFLWVKDQTIGSHSDWFIPSRGEFDALWANRGTSVVQAVIDSISSNFAATSNVDNRNDIGSSDLTLIDLFIFSKVTGSTSIVTSLNGFLSTFIIARSFDDDVPSAPANVTATPGNGQVTVSWTAPRGSVGSYEVTGTTATPGVGSSCQIVGDPPSPTSCVIPADNGVEYTFTVLAKTSAGVAGASSSSVTATPRTVPGPPREVVAAAGVTQASVSWTAPTNDGGTTITNYIVTSSPDNRTCSTSGALACTVTGLTPGRSYTFTVTAANVAGSGSASVASNAVTPTAVPAPTPALETPTPAPAAPTPAPAVPTPAITPTPILEEPIKPTTRTTKATVYFAASSSTLDAKAKRTLRALVKGRTKSTVRTVSVGYAFSNNWRSANRQLAQRRAVAVANYLKSRGVTGASVTRTQGSNPMTRNAGRKAVVTLSYRD